MSFNYEEKILNNSFVHNEASMNHNLANYSVSSQIAEDASTRIATDLLLGNTVGSASVSFSANGAGTSIANLSAIGYGNSVGSLTVHSSANSAYLSEVEQAILRSSDPISINESEEITINGQRGIWANKSEVINWRGEIPINQYSINEDSSPELITKRSQLQLDYVQEMAVRYLRPPTPPAPGEIIIQQQPNILTPPAPPLIIRQQPARPSTPEPLVIREAPPQPPAQVGKKVITISGKRIPPPPRKVIIERLAPLPAKPQSVIIERWLPYSEVKRKVIFQKPNQADPVLIKPKNIIVQWEAPQVNIKKEIKYLGVIRANPAEYVSRYGTNLKQSNELPEFVNDIRTPDGLVLAANFRQNSLHELEGDVHALQLIDLDQEGLSEYKSYLQRFGNSHDGFSAFNASYSANSASYESSGDGYNIETESKSLASISALAEQIFNRLDVNGDNSLSVNEAEKALLNLNSKLGRSYGEDELRAFFSNFDLNGDGKLNINEFRRVFFDLLN